MKYCLELSNQDITKVGMSVFIAMSTKHFKPIFNFLGCKFTFDDRLSRIAREFVENALPAIGISTPSKKVDRDAEDTDVYLNAWQATFEKLESIGYREEVCNWMGKLHIEQTNKLHIRIASGAPLWFLRDWSMERWTASPLNLPYEKIQQIKLLALQMIVGNLEWQARLESITRDIDFDVWEEFAYKKRGGETWMSNEAYFQRRLSMWIGVFSILTKQELIILGQWWESEIERYIGFVDTHNDVDLIAFSNDLRELGYINNTISSS